MNPYHLRRQRGLTLIELLVTVVILSFTIALMSGAFSQIAQMLRISSEYSSGFVERWNRSRALYDMVNNMVIDPTLEKPFTGQYQRIEMVTLASPGGPPGVARPAQVTLKAATEIDGGTELLVANPNDDKRAPPQKLARLPGRLEFRFIDHRGDEHIQWPPSGVAEYRPMPSSIVLRDLDGKTPMYRIATYEGPLSPKNNALAQAFGAGR